MDNDGKLALRTIKQIDEARARIKSGHYITEAEAKKRLFWANLLFTFSGV